MSEPWNQPLWRVPQMLLHDSQKKIQHALAFNTEIGHSQPHNLQSAMHLPWQAQLQCIMTRRSVGPPKPDENQFKYIHGNHCGSRQEPTRPSTC